MARVGGRDQRKGTRSAKGRVLENEISERARVGVEISVAPSFTRGQKRERKKKETDIMYI